jgi:hypothetical protein
MVVCNDLHLGTDLIFNAQKRNDTQHGVAKKGEVCKRIMTPVELPDDKQVPGRK